MKKLFIILCCMLITPVIQAQNTIHIGSGVTVMGTGSVTVVYNANNFVNNGSYSDAAGTVVAVGPLTVSGTGTTSLFNYMNNNTGTTTLNAQVSVRNEATLTSGTLAVNTENLYIRTDINPLAGMIVTGVLTGTVKGLATYSTATSGACPVATTFSTNVSGPAIIYQWQSSPDNSAWTNISGATNDTYPASVTATGYYRCNLSTNNSPYAASTPSILVTTTGGPAIDAGPATTMCTNSPKTLTAYGGISYTWTPAASLSATTGTSVIANPGSTTVYTVTGTDALGCSNKDTVTVSVYGAHSPIGGTVNIMENKTTTLTDATAGGVWSSATTTVATINPTTRVVQGVQAGQSVISYTIGTCAVTTTVVVHAAALCVGSTIQLSDATPGGTWLSTNNSVANITATTGYITGVSANRVTVNYYLPAGVVHTQTLTVNQLVQTTTSSGSQLCSGAAITLVNASSPSGTWGSNKPSVASIPASGSTVTATTSGSGWVDILYFTPKGCLSVKTFNINPVPALSGAPAICAGQTAALASNISGGTWTGSADAIGTVTAAGVVTGVAAGTVRFSYSLPTGCLNSATVSVKALSPTTGPSSVCQAQSISLVNTTAGGGTWSSNNSAVATVTGGTVYGASGGTANISFTTTGGCIATRSVTVNGTNPITGANTVCVGQTVNISNSTAGGMWSTNSGSIASIQAPGLFRGIGNGTARVTYMLPGGCYSTATVTVNALSPITGGTSGICASGSMTLANTTPFGGIWSTSNSSAATVNPTTGFVKGTGAGSTVISFTTTSGGCVATRTVTVNACRESGQSTAVIQTTAKDDITLYPNPNNGQFTLMGSLDIADGEVSIEVVNMLGQVIYRNTAQVLNGTINKQIKLQSDPAGGMYILSLRTEKVHRQLRFVVD